MTIRLRSRRTQALAVAVTLVAGALAATPLATASSASSSGLVAQKGQTAEEKREDARAARHVRSCARPALSPSVKLEPEDKGAAKGTKEQRRAPRRRSGRTHRQGARPRAGAGDRGRPRRRPQGPS